MLSLSLSLSALLLASTTASIIPEELPHTHQAQRGLSKRWYHDDDHPVHALFRRGDDRQTYAQVGSPAWSALFPQSTPDSSNMPQEWKDALTTAQGAGKIPNIQVSKNAGGIPRYPSGTDPMSKGVCSAYSKCRQPGDIWDAPEGFFGTGFDDGPFLGSSQLYDFLESNNIAATHFMIGVYILNDPTNFLRAFQKQGSDIAAHTWTHPLMTTLSNEDVVAQLGWTMEIIHNSTGGRVPRFWRPPYGDADNRVRAIAKEVLGLDMIMWNQDTEDWSMGEPGGTTMGKINASMTQWLNGSKKPGLIILEHELNNNTVQAFMNAYSTIKATGWNMVSVAELADGDPNNGQVGVWQNADDNTGAVTLQPVGQASAGDGGGSNTMSGPRGSATGPAPSNTESSGNNAAPASQTPDGSALSTSLSLPYLWWLLSIGFAVLLL